VCGPMGSIGKVKRRVGWKAMSWKDGPKLLSVGSIEKSGTKPKQKQSPDFVRMHDTESKGVVLEILESSLRQNSAD
jgi:hypothetical protein